MIACESLPNDGAPFRCGRKGKYDYAKKSATCDEPAVRLLTGEAYTALTDLFSWRAVCAQHATEAAMLLEDED